MWYYAKGTQAVGPLDESQVRRAIIASRITPDTLVWRMGLAGWMRADAASEISELFRSTPPPIPDASSSSSVPTPFERRPEIWPVSARQPGQTTASVDPVDLS